MEPPQSKHWAVHLASIKSNSIVTNPQELTDSPLKHIEASHLHGQWLHYATKIVCCLYHLYGSHTKLFIPQEFTELKYRIFLLWLQKHIKICSRLQVILRTYCRIEIKAACSGLISLIEQTSIAPFLGLCSTWWRVAMTCGASVILAVPAKTWELHRNGQ